MKEKVGEVFSIAKDNVPVPGCTISKEVQRGDDYISYFSLAKGTDISAEIYSYHKLIIVCDGSLEVYGAWENSKKLVAGEAIVTPTDVTVGMRSAQGAVYAEVLLR